MKALAALALLVSLGPSATTSVAAPARQPARPRLAVLAIERHGDRFAAALRIRPQAEAKVRIKLRLRARPPWPETPWRTIRRWRLTRTVNPEGRLRLWAAGAPAACHHQAECELRAAARIAPRGRSPLRRGARRRLATGIWEPDIRAARRYARRRGDTSFAVVDLHSRLRGYRAAHTTASASVIKATLLAAYLRQRSVRGRPLHAREKALLEPMIRVSDNGAAAQVASLLGGDRIERFARKVVGMRDFRWIGTRGYIGGSSRISARDEALFFYRFDRYVPDRHRRYARHLLASVIPWQRWGIGRARPHGWRLYLKGGWGISDGGPGTVNHQVAFLERGRCRIALAILTEHNPSHSHGIETLRGVAARLFRGVATAPCGPGQAGESIFGKSGGTLSTF